MRNMQTCDKTQLSPTKSKSKPIQMLIMCHNSLKYSSICSSQCYLSFGIHTRSLVHLEATHLLAWNECQYIEILILPMMDEHSRFFLWWINPALSYLITRAIIMFSLELLEILTFPRLSFCSILRLSKYHKWHWALIVQFHDTEHMGD